MLLDCELCKYFSGSPPLRWALRAIMGLIQLFSFSHVKARMNQSWEFPFSSCGTLELTRVGCFSLPGHLHSGNTPAARALVPPEGGPYQEQRALAYFKNCSFPNPLPARSTKGFFSDIYCGNLVKLLEVKLTVGVSLWLCSLEFLTFRVFHIELPAIHPLQHRFPSSSMCFPLVSLCSGKPGLPVLTCPSLQSWRQQFATCQHISNRSRRVVGFSGQLFPYQDRVETSKLLRCGTGSPLI